MLFDNRKKQMGISGIRVVNFIINHFTIPIILTQVKEDAYGKLRRRGQRFGMKVKEIPQSKLTAAVALLNEHIPGLTYDNLIAALKLYGGDSTASVEIEPGQLLTVEDTANRLRVCRRTVWNWIQNGRMKTVHLNKHLIRIPEAEVVKFALDTPTPNKKVR